ncbi:hypothetical protein EAE91_17910 [Photorhabdus noenieputensis]|uniref:hypothetical protein n=1 Tax=Photorhabdus noenieputensis TaxID=1208607 RepID=UPI001BD265B2|nr:hypothetical protein [Photorhabdus noenieputensis]MBS9438938.1 hypothetical protein [Photorhabdus noenieputensis]MCK3669774.1 hypothetical protein [Photorhabdus noenieputensis]
MINQDNLNSIKEVIMLFAKKEHIPVQKLHDYWKSDYKNDWDMSFTKDVALLNREISLLKQALEKNDKVTQIAALVVARGIALGIMNQFENLFEDIENMAWSDEFKWPKIPEDYKIPDHYNYPEKK